MGKYDDMTCPKCNGQMEISPGGQYMQCKYCDYRKKIKYKDRTSINVSYVNNSYHDNRRYKYTDNSGKWNAIKEIFNGEVGEILAPILGICILLAILFLIFTIDEFVNRDEYAAKRSAQIAYEEYVRSVPHNTLPVTTYDAIGANYEDIITQIENSGFTNVSAVKTTPEKFSDKVKTPNNSVMNITVDGSIVYDSSKNYPLDIPIIVYYYDKW